MNEILTEQNTKIFYFNIDHFKEAKFYNSEIGEYENDNEHQKILEKYNISQAPSLLNKYTSEVMILNYFSDLSDHEIEEEVKMFIEKTVMPSKYISQYTVLIAIYIYSNILIILIYLSIKHIKNQDIILMFFLSNIFLIFICLFLFISIFNTINYNKYSANINITPLLLYTLIINFFSILKVFYIEKTDDN